MKFVGFQVMVLHKLNAVIENQKSIISAIKQISSSGRADGSFVIEDLLPQPFNKLDELEILRESLQEAQYKRKMVMLFFQTFLEFIDKYYIW